MDIVVLSLAVIAALALGFAAGARQARRANNARAAAHTNLTKTKRDLAEQRNATKAAIAERETLTGTVEALTHEQQRLRGALSHSQQQLATQQEALTAAAHDGHRRLIDIVGIETEVASLRVIARDLPVLRARVIELEAALASTAPPVDLRPAPAIAS